MKHNSDLTPLAQKLRRNMTKEERKLWYEYLRTYPLRFRRQVTVGRYIVDFYCAAAKLVLELDGSQHYMPEGQAEDGERTAYLESLGIQVLRLSNTDVLQNLRGVCEEIDKTVQMRTRRPAHGPEIM